MLEWWNEIDISCVCGTESVFLLPLSFFVLVCLYSKGVLVQELCSKFVNWCLLLWANVVGKAGVPPRFWFLKLLQHAGKMGESEMEDNRDMVVEDECVVCIQNLGGSLVLIFIRASILICVVAVVVMGVPCP